MRRIIKFVFQLAFFVGLGFVAYALFADLPAPTEEKVIVVPLPQGDK